MSSISRQLSSIRVSVNKPSSSSAEVRLVLLGKTGSGKSSTANSILGSKVFDSKVSSSSVTQQCHRVSGEFRGRNLTLLDTPGLLDTRQTPQEVQKELRKSVSLLYPGPHTFLIVIQIGRYTQEEKDTVWQIEQAMGAFAFGLSVVVFTHGDLLEEGTSVKQCMIDGCKDVAELVARCGGRYCIFNNQSFKNKEQVSEMLALVDSMMQENGGICYSSTMLQKLEMVQQKSKMEMEELKKRQQFEKKDEEKLSRDHDEAFRRVMEEYVKREKETKPQEMVRLMEKPGGQNEKSNGEEYPKGKRGKLKEREREGISANTEEQASRQREEMRRDTFQKELDKLTMSLKEQSKKEEDTKRQMESLIRRERKESQRERDIQMENMRAEKRRTLALQQELKIIRMKGEKQKETEENLKRQLEENLQMEREKCIKEMSALKKQYDKKPCTETMKKRSAEKHSTLTTVTGYAQEMGLLRLNAALETVGAPCCIQ
ncbi:GTPase IMAP family member 9 [Dissostichus eleginoides]|uniref:GTPase IMAP family member 9 n=1 Tax=Dissostichus eleginoides TaxID=100907 RepID=A0AAD9EZ28_DISEL|nr:GTPase IMAP family member 9 [Dissostichus eleginoides]